ncbi:MAG: proton-conducting transporter membrane subunit [Raoultibacter sp.]|jgi:hydrogenase-4 component B
MIDLITSSACFVAVILLFALGAAGSLVAGKNDTLANLWGNSCAIAGSLLGIVFACSVLMTAGDVVLVVEQTMLPILSITFTIDKLSAFFMLTISLVALFCTIYAIGYIKHFYKRYSIGALGFFYNLFIIGMILVVTASNSMLFLAVWEIMSIASYFLVVYDRDDANNVKAGFLYLVMTHVGTAFIFVALFLLYKYTGSFDFATIKLAAGEIPLATKNAVFVLAIIGFGTKAGMIPFHIWLPSAHPAAPSHVSGLMSGVMIKTGIYMMIRLYLDILQPVPEWWGLALLILGSISALLGVLYALTEHDIKRLLAYHSIENVGIILLGLGSALTFSSLGMMQLSLLSLIAALFHTLNHAVFKSLLFLSAGSVINETHTRNMEKYGGLIRFMPQTAVFFLIGAVAISGLPPFNGFFSEWMTFQSLFQGIVALDMTGRFVFIIATGSLAFTGGLAIACFVKAFAVTFLARPRSEAVQKAKDPALPLRIGMACLAALCLAFGVFSGELIAVIQNICLSLGAFQGVSPAASLQSGTVSVGDGFAGVSAPAIFAFLIVGIAVTLFVFKRLVNKNQKVTKNRTWDCGVDLKPRMEITATGFARSIVLIFRGILKPSTQRDVEYHDAETRYLPKSVSVSAGRRDIYDKYFYEPMRKGLVAAAMLVRKIQSGNVNVYILYVLAALIFYILVMQS